MSDLQPSGDFLKFDSGLLQGRIYRLTGHISLVGPDLNGAPAANNIILAPPVAQTAGGPVAFGAIKSSAILGDGLELTQAFGTREITSRLTFPHEGVMHYEVVDWKG